MAFNSLTFLLFLSLFMLGWQFVRNHVRIKLLYIVAGSSVFYGWWDWRFLFLIYYVGGVDYLLMSVLDRIPKTKRFGLLLVSICNALGVLFIFKYSLFFSGIVDHLFQWMNVDFRLSRHIPEFCLILPVGISFFTFQSMSYTIDVYRGKLQPARSYIHYMAYLMLFPQLVAGPIVRASDLLLKLLEKPRATAMTSYAALKLILLGFFKKCILADNIAPFVNNCFSETYYYQNCWVWWTATILFAIQIYCDFSGYSDIARGIIKWMGYRFVLNFNHPYISGSFKEFWGRWHISLSTWFRDYVYIPLGGSRGKENGKPVSKWFGLRNLWISFLLSGLWHGAAWNFLIWGALHSLFLSVERLTGYTQYLQQRKFLRWAGILLVQLQVLAAWVFFRAQTFGEASHVLRCMFSFDTSGEMTVTPCEVFYFGLFVLMESFLIFNGDHWLHRIFKKYYYAVSPILLGLVAFCIIFFRGNGYEFIYFQF